MNKKTLISLEQICECLHVDTQIVIEFADFGLYPLVSVEGEFAIETRNFERVERVISLYQTFGINKEGIDIILELREEIANLQEQIKVLQSGTEQLKIGFAQGLQIEINEY